MANSIRITLDLEEARQSVEDGINAYCGGSYEYLPKQAAIMSYLVHSTCVLNSMANHPHAQDAADLVCLGDELIPFINGLASALKREPRDLAADILPALVALNCKGHNVLAVARRHYGVTVDRFPRRGVGGAQVVELSNFMARGA